MSEEIKLDKEIETYEALERLKTLAKPFMQPELPYHNWSGHILYSYNFALNRCAQYEKSGKINIDKLMVGSAVLFHDANVAKELPKKYESKEAYSADIAGEVLSEINMSDQFIKGVRGCVLKTHLDAIPETPEEKLTCMADIANVFGTYPGFLINSFRFYAETCQLAGTNISFRDYRRTSRQILTKYLSKDLVIDEAVDCDVLVKPIYYLDGFRNIERFTRASSSQLESTLRSIGDSALNLIDLVPEPVKRGMRIMSGDRSAEN